MPDGVALPPFGGAEAGDDASRRRRSGLDDSAVRPYSTAAGDDASRRRRSGLGSARASWHVRCSSFLAPARQQHDADRQAAVAGRSKPSGRWVDGPEQVFCYLCGCLIRLAAAPIRPSSRGSVIPFFLAYRYPGIVWGFWPLRRRYVYHSESAWGPILVYRPETPLTGFEGPRRSLVPSRFGVRSRTCLVVLPSARN